MSLTTEKAAFITALTALYEDLTAGVTAAAKASDVADTMETWIKAAVLDATIPASTYVVSGEIPIGVVSQGVSPAVVVNTVPIPITVTMNPAPKGIKGDPGGGVDDAGGIT